MAGFEKSGLAGKQSVREGLMNCNEPDKFISTFQQENCVLLSSLHPALHLLDLQDVKRVTFHQSVISDLSHKFFKQINSTETSQEKLKELLDHTIQFIHVENLRPVIMATMKKMAQLKPETIELVASNDKIYHDCPIEVKRKVWVQKHPLFGDAVGPVLNKYIEDKHSLLYNTDNIKNRNFFSLPPRQRRQKTVVKSLVEMIGTSIELYNLVLQFLRTLFLRTKEDHYCSLRSELLMAFHDADVKEIQQVDPCHKFTWCLDACVREKCIDSRRLKELQSFLDNIKKGQEEVMGDIAMILCDPYATNTIILSILQQLNELIKKDILPRSSSVLMFLIRLLTLSVNAWDMIKAQNFKEAVVNGDIITKFLPTLMLIMMDCSIGTSAQNIKVLPTLWKFLKEDILAQLVTIYYVNQLVQLNKSNAMEMILPQFSQSVKSHTLSSTVLNSLVSNFVRHVDQFKKPSYCNLVFEQFLFVWLQHEETLHHVLRLMWCVYENIESPLMVRLLTATQPTSQHSDVIHDLHARLVDVIASSKVSTPSSCERSSSPITPPNLLTSSITAAN